MPIREGQKKTPKQQNNETIEIAAKKRNLSYSMQQLEWLCSNSSFLLLKASTIHLGFPRYRLFDQEAVIIMKAEKERKKNEYPTLKRKIKMVVHLHNEVDEVIALYDSVSTLSKIVYRLMK